MFALDRIGEERVMNCGMKVKIIAYRSAKDIDVEFEDGSIRTNIQYCNFKKGEVINIKFENLKDIRLNEENINSQNIKMKIIEYNSSQDIKVEFEDGYIKKCLYHDFKKGKVKNPYYKYLYNRGYLGEAKTTDGKGNPLRAYQIWQHIFERCYSDEFHKNYPTYKGCEVCEEWYCYTNFKKWYDEHYYELENERVELDKDILIKGNRIYSPETCIFVPKKINIIFSRNNPKENGLPRGVSWDKENKKISRSI